MTSYTITQIPAPRTPLIEPTTGLMSREWFRWFNNVNNIVGAGRGVIAVINGGTGQSSYTDGELLIGNSVGNTLTKSTLSAGTGIRVTNGPGSITLSTRNANVTPGTYGSASEVPRVTFDADGNILSIANVLIGIDASQIVSGALPIAFGGTGATTAAQARINLGISPYQTYQIATAGQTVFTGLTYTVGNNSLKVYVNGSKQIVTVNYNETNSTTVTFVNGLNVGDYVEFTN